MCSFKISHDDSSGILVVVVEGAADIDSIVAYTEQHIEVWANNPRVLRDLRDMDVTNVSSDQICNLTSKFSQANDRRNGDRSAIVTEMGLGFSLGRLLLTYAELNEAAVDHRLFQKRYDAEAWLWSRAQ